jgi:competence protein ComGC
LSEWFRRVQDERGFTLVEMMAVLVVISILVSIVLGSYIFSTRKARETTCSANVRIVNEMATKYFYDTGGWPDTLDDLIPNYIRDSKSFVCPDSGQPYNYDNSTGAVTCPSCPP